MGKVHLITTGHTFTIDIRQSESLMEGLRRNNVPLQGTLLVDKNRGFVSLTKTLQEDDEVWAYSLRNADFTCILPEYEVFTTPEPVTELIRPVGDPKSLALIQFSRAEALDYIYASVEASLARYATTESGSTTLQVALSPGGDGRILAECIRRYWDTHQHLDFHCIIVAVGFEEEQEHIGKATEIAQRFSLPYTTLGVRDAATTLGYRRDLKEISDRYREDYSRDEPEVMLTYWVQQVNFALARENNRHGIIFGYNQEDIIAERLYHLISGRSLDGFPVRKVQDIEVIAPLYKIPKKMLDSMDMSNSLRNYNIRRPSISYLRSSLYLLSYLIVEQFPAIADQLSGEPLQAEHADLILNWLDKQ